MVFSLPPSFSVRCTLLIFFPLIWVFLLSCKHLSHLSILFKIQESFLCNVQWKAIMLQNIRDGFVMSGTVKSCCLLKSLVNGAKGMIWLLNKASVRSPSPPQNSPRWERDSGSGWKSFFPLKDCGGSVKPCFWVLLARQKQYLQR